MYVVGSLSAYYFMVNQIDGLTLYHPMLPRPSDPEDDPISVRINFLERDADREGIIASLLRLDEAPPIHACTCRTAMPHDRDIRNDIVDDGIQRL